VQGERGSIRLTQRCALTDFSRQRVAVLAAACALGWGAWSVLRGVAPAADPTTAAAVALLAFAGCGALAFTLDRKGLAAFAPVGVCFAIPALAAGLAIHDAERLTLLFGFGSVALMAFCGYALARAARWRKTERTTGVWILCVGLTVLLGLYCLAYVAVSHDLMFSDFMSYRIESIALASLLDHGEFGAVVRVSIESMKDEYSLLPALGPAAALALTSLTSRACYQAAVIALFAAPAYLALGVLARDLARRAGFGRAETPRPALVLALAVGAAVVAYPTGMAVVARGMPDIGGLVLVVAGLRLSERLARLLAMPPGHDAWIGRLSRRVTLALALSLFGMFLFRRWYAFAAVGIVSMLMLEIAILAVHRRARFRWAELASAGALGGLTLLGMCAPVLIDWLPNPAAHDYVTIYAAYKQAPAAVMAAIFDWYGAALLAAAFGCAIFLGVRPGDARLLRLTCGATAVAAILFLRVQSPAIHHAYLLTPAVAAVIGAVVLVAFQWRRTVAVGALIALAAFTLTPAVSGWAPKGFAPTAGRPPAPRSDLAELDRLKAWLDVNASPEHRYCLLGSSSTINDVLVAELWQLRPGGSPLVREAARNYVATPHVDTRDGPPNAGLKDCAIMLVGDPVQTHLAPAYQQNVIVPAGEMLSGVGIGADYRRTGEGFELEKGVKLIVFERTRALGNEDVAALQARWRAARTAAADSGARASP
jgi:hypothetical protein